MGRTPASLPRRDTTMAAILLGVMLAADAVALVHGVAPGRARAAMVLTPLSFALIWIGYAVSLRNHARRACGDTRTVGKSAGFMGSILSLMGGVMVIAHIALLGRFVWFQGLTAGQLSRAYMAAIGVIVMIIFDRAPKVMTVAPDGPLAKLRIHRTAALVGVACGLGMVITAVTAPRHQMVLWFFTLAVTPVILNRILIRKARPPHGG
jgi:hypothetical protein